MSEIIVSICLDHKGDIERSDVTIRDIKAYYDIKIKTCIFTFGRDDKGIYSSYDFNQYRNDDRFFKIKDIPTQLQLNINKELKEVYERALSVYMTGIRDEKLIEIGII